MRVRLEHPDALAARPDPVQVAEPAVPIAPRAAFSVFLPEKEQGDVLFMKLLVNPGPIRKRPLGHRDQLRNKKNPRFKRRFVHIVGQGPADSPRLGPPQIIGNRTPSDSLADCDLPGRQSASPP